MQGFEINMAGTWYDLNDKTTYKVMGYDNLGMAPGHDISERGPMQHGETYVGQRLDPRIFSLAIRVMGSTASAMAANRLALYLMFKPRSSLVAMRFTTADGRVGHLDCTFAGGLELGQTGKDSPLSIKTAVSMKAPNPTFYDPVAKAVTFQLGAGAGAGMAIPTAIPTAIGSTTVNSSKTVSTSGSWLTYPQIRITGPITSPIITNTSTNETLDFTGTTIAAGHYYDIDCRYGYKTILYDSTTTSKIADLTGASDLATFHLESAPEVLGGHNNFTVTGTSATAATKVQMTYFDRYIGI